MRSAAATLRIGDRLDRRFAMLRGEMERAKEKSLLAVARTLDAADVPYALVDGVAVQIWSAEPRTTLDIDLAVTSYDALPRDELEKAGFSRVGRFAHSENWKGPDGTPVQFSDDPAFGDAIRGAQRRTVAKVPLRVAPVLELVRSKLRAADDPSRRKSKRLMDLADAVALIEQHPAVMKKLGAAERRRIKA